jgi:hypothetical protein
MQRLFFASLVSLVSLGAAACDWGHHHAVRVVDPCLSATSCGTCTPRPGCGWCASSAGGRCLSQPNECSGAQFTWTWEPAACTGSGLSGDGGQSARDAGWTSGSDAADGPTSDATADASSDGVCRWPASANTFSAADASLNGCLPSVGGNLCPTSQYTLTCHGQSGAAVPDPALGCAVVPVPAPGGVLYYCCPCG